MQKRLNDSYDEFDNDGSDKDPRFSEFIKEKIEQYNEDNKDKMTIKKLGETLGIDYGMFRRKITKEKPIRERDCIIAICVVLQLSPGEIDAALDSYDMQPLNKKVERDVFIEGLVLKASLNKSYNLNFNLLNNYLRAMEFDELVIQKHKNDTSSNKTQIKRKTSRYKVIIDACVDSLEESEIYFGDHYGSLSTEYDPSELTVTGHMLLSDSQDNKIRLEATSKGKLSTKTLGKDKFKKEYKSIEDTGDFKEFFVKLDSRVKLEWFRVLNVLKDTRSYRGRASAKVADDKLCVFTEEFNYTVPELNEFFFMTRTNEKYELKVFNESAFMQCYLDPEKYKKLYDQKLVKAKEIYNSAEEIANLIVKAEKYSAEYFRLRLRLRVFNNLKKTVDDLFQNIKEEKVLINNPDQIYGNEAEWEILKYYKLEKDFVYEHIQFDDGERINYFTDKDYRLKNGQVINISHADLLDAFKLGIRSFEDVLRIKSELGYIKAIIK